MNWLLKEWRLYAVAAIGALVVVMGGTMLGFYTSIPTYHENAAYALPRMVAMAAYPDDGAACHAEAAAEIRGIAAAIDANPGMASERTMAWHGDASIAREAYRDELDERGIAVLGHGVLSDMEVAVDAWLDGADGSGPATPGCWRR